MAGWRLAGGWLAGWLVGKGIWFRSWGDPPGGLRGDPGGFPFKILPSCQVAKLLAERRLHKTYAVLRPLKEESNILEYRIRKPYAVLRPHTKHDGFIIGKE